MAGPCLQTRCEAAGEENRRRTTPLVQRRALREAVVRTQGSKTRSEEGKKSRTQCGAGWGEAAVRDDSRILGWTLWLAGAHSFFSPSPVFPLLKPPLVPAPLTPVPVPLSDHQGPLHIPLPPHVHFIAVICLLVGLSVKHYVSLHFTSNKNFKAM